MGKSFNHSYITSNLSGILRACKDYTTLIELSIEIQNKEFVPDIALYSKRKMKRSGMPPSEDIIRMTEMPLLAVEILSPKQSSQDVLEKIKVYFENNIKSCWFVVPATRTTTVYKSFEDFVTYTETMQFTDENLGLNVNVAEIFE